MQPTRTGLTRRAFVQSAASAAAWAAIGKAAESEPAAARSGKMKIGCTSWAFHNFAAGTDPTNAIDTIADIGFDGIELIVNARDDFDTIWSNDGADRIRKHLEQRKLAISQLVLFHPVVAGLSSLDADTRNRSLDAFERGCRVGKRLGAPIINIVAPWPREVGAEHGYLPRFYELPNPKEGEKFRVSVSAEFDWDRVWDQFVETVKGCLQRAKQHGLEFTIEHHTHCLVHDATSFLRLWDAVRDPNLGYNLDTGWTLAQREYPPIAIHKTRRHLMNLHVRDIDGMMRRFPPVGTGVMDFKAVIDACKQAGFSGFLSIEQDKYDEDMRQVCRRYLAMMREYIG
jgi:sugar phosphate isomerase/epimerase